MEKVSNNILFKNEVKHFELLRYTQKHHDQYHSFRILMHNTYRNVDKLTNDDLFEMASMYDEVFFLGELLKRYDTNVIFASNLRKAAGNISVSLIQKKCVIKLSRLILLKYTVEGNEYDVNGVRISNRLDAIMRVLEHELIHLYLFECGESNHGHGMDFQNAALNFFSHKRTTHNLNTWKEQKDGIDKIPYKHSTIFSKEDIKGKMIAFVDRGTRYEGYVTRTGKRVSVIVDETYNWKVAYCNIIEVMGNVNYVQKMKEKYSGKTVLVKLNNGTIVNGKVIHFGTKRAKVELYTGLMYCQVAYSNLLGEEK